MAPSFFIGVLMANSEIEICNLAQSRLGDKASIENIDTPKKAEERVYSKWYHISRQAALRLLKPNFAIKREFWACDANYKPAFGYDYAYKIKSDCLRVLTIGGVDTRALNYPVENGYLLTNDYQGGALPVRYVADVTDIKKFTPDFIRLFSWQLAYDVCFEITESEQAMNRMEQILPLKMAEFCGTDAQENRPKRINRSKLLADRHGFNGGQS